jgi:uncharacterized protein (TIGR03790 family)
MRRAVTVAGMVVLLAACIGCGRKSKDDGFFVRPVPEGEDRILVIVNTNSAISQAIGDYYLSKRPAAYSCLIAAPATETISRTDYDDTLKATVEDYLTTNSLADTIYYIVTTKGVPLRISAESGDDNASVDSELALLFRSYTLASRFTNPYYGASARFDRSYNIYLVTRLTGYETDGDADGIPDDVKALIDRGTAPAWRPAGKFVLDVDPTRDGGSYQVGNDWMRDAATGLAAGGFDCFLDETTTFVTGQTDVIGYCSWGSNDNNSPACPYTLGHTWRAGAIVTTYVSTNARSFQTGTGYGQSLVADLIAEGITGANGHVYEPYLDACSHPDLLFDRYTSGFNLAESFYCSIRYLSWQNVVIGDPLCAPWQ